MSFWILQLVLNLFLVCLGVLWLRSRSEQKFLAERLEKLEKILNKVPLHTESEVKTSPQVLSSAQSEVASLAKASSERASTLSERLQPELSTRSKNAAELYIKADYLLSRGVDAARVAKETGLSLAELRLIEKMAQRNH